MQLQGATRLQAKAYWCTPSAERRNADATPQMRRLESLPRNAADKPPEAFS